MIDCDTNPPVECRQLDDASLRKLGNIHPDLYKVVIYARGHSKVEFVVDCGQRNKEQQRKYVKQGTSTTMNSKHLVQPDGYAHAVDLVPVVGGKRSWDWKLIYQIAEAMRESAQHHNVEVTWGGFWGTVNDTKKPLEDIVNDYVRGRKDKVQRVFLDGPHFELKTS